MKLFNPIREWINRHELLCSVLVVIVIALITFLPSVKDSGFYADDYHAVYGAYTYGPEKILITAMIDRPGAGFTLEWLYLLFGPRIHCYQALVIILDIATALCALWILRKIWPGKKAIAVSVAVMMVIYPGFNEFMQSYNFSLMLMSVFFYISSIALSIVVLKSNRPVTRVLLTVLAALLALWSVFLNEYYLGLEVLRFGVIYLIVKTKSGSDVRPLKRLLRTLTAYLPYLFTAGGFFIWRFFVFNSTRTATNLGFFVNIFSSSPVYKLLTLLSGLFNNLLNITLFAWFEPAYRYLNSLRLKDFLFCTAIGIVGAVIVFIFFHFRRKNDSENEANKKEMRQMVLLGLATVIGTSLPIVFVGREVTFTEYSKYSLSGMIGGVMILAALIHYYVKPEVRPLLLAFLIFSGIAAQLGVAKGLAADWEGSKELWWQLSWRAPSLKPGTLLSGRDVNYNFEEGFNIWGPVNMMYYPTAKNPVIIGETLNSNLIKAAQLDQDPLRDFRTYILNMETSKLLIMSVPSNVSCLHLIDGEAPDYSVYDSSEIQLIGEYSRLDQIDLTATPTTPPVIMFGPEPSHGWCYAYQKAELALQKGDYQEVKRIWDESILNDLHPDDQIELLPFILAYAELGDEKTLHELLPMFFDTAFHKYRYCINLREKNYRISDSAAQLLLNLSCAQ